MGEVETLPQRARSTKPWRRCHTAALELLEGKPLPGVTALDAAPEASRRKYILGGNWKSNPGTLAGVKDLCGTLGACKFDATSIEVAVFPTALHGQIVQGCLANSGMEVGTQNVSKTGAGAFTGEWSAEMVAECGFGWTLIGHSERRTRYGETDQDTAEKVSMALNAGLRVILCIGETLEEREKGITDQINQRQLKACIPVIRDWDRVVIAYEPVWAIGTGKVATPEQAQETQKSVRDYIRSQCGDAVANRVRIQYGGSANPANCADLIKQPDIDGFLVGGASLKPDFVKMIEICGQ